MKNWHKGTYSNIMITFVLTVTFGCMACLLFKDNLYFACGVTGLVGAVSLRLCLDQYNRLSCRKSYELTRKK